MKRTIAVILLVAFMIPFALPGVLMAEQASPAGVTDAANKLCPVSGHPVSGTVAVEFQNRRYGLCCPACKAAFLADPAKYITQMEAQEKASQPVASQEAERDMEQAEL